MAGKPPPKPIYVFRPAHQDLLNANNNEENKNTRCINHLEFINLEEVSKGFQPHLSLLAVDNHGWASIWNLESRRIQSLWLPHPHTESIGGCLWASPLYQHHTRQSNSSDSQDPPPSSILILSQGRDHKLKLNRIDNYIETCTTLTITRANLKPTINSPSTNVKIVAETFINSINFCKASLLKLGDFQFEKSSSSNHDYLKIHSIVAVPSSITEELVDIFGVQIEEPPQIIKMYQAIPSSNKKQGRGSVVAVQLFTPSGAEEDLIILIIAYESGEVKILKNERIKKLKFNNFNFNSDWEMIAIFKCHTEPILSLAISIDPVDPLAGIAWSVGADKNIVKYHFSCLKINPSSNPSSPGQTKKVKYQIKAKAMVFETNQVGRFDIKVRSDSKVVGIYNWGGKIWLFDSKEIPISDEKNKNEFESYEYIKLKPIGLLKLPTDPSNKSGVIAFSPFPFPSPATFDFNYTNTPHHLDSLVGLALLVASGSGGQVTAWEVFPPSTSDLAVQTPHH